LPGKEEPLVNELLALSDIIRDESLPSLGVRVQVCMNMYVLALNDDVKFIISKHLASDLKIRTLLSKNHDLQKNIIWRHHV
jgi:hypothetical protein